MKNEAWLTVLIVCLTTAIDDYSPGVLVLFASIIMSDNDFRGHYKDYC